MRNQLSTPLEGSDPKDGRSPLRRFRGVIVPLLVVVAIVVVASVLVAARAMFEPQTLESGRQHVRAMKSDPIVGFRAPGTSLLNQEEHPAVRYPLGGGETESSIRQSFEMTGDPGDSVGAYRLAAQANGWEFVADGCSRVRRATAAVFGKRLGSFDATLVVHAQLDRPALEREYAVGRQGLRVTLTPGPAGVGDLSVDAGIHRNDLHCLRGVDPLGADLQPPAPPTLELGELCSRLPVPAAKAIAPQVEAVSFAPATSQCWLVNAAGHYQFSIEHARHPRAYYEDRRLPSAQGSTERFSFSVHGKKDPERARSVWSRAPSGTYVVGDPAGMGTEDHLFGVTRLVAAVDPRPTPTAPLKPGLPESNVPILIEYALDGGIGGTRRVVVTTDGQAAYTRGGAQPVRFAVPPETMGDLRAALARVDFGKLSPSHGSASGPDTQVEVFTYQGKTVRVASGRPSELGRVAAVLNGLLEEGSRHR